SRQSRQSSQLSVRGTQALAACDSASQSAEREYVGAPGAFCGPVAPRPQDSSSLPPFALRCQASEVRAVCGSSASTGPRGGRWATGVPTATRIGLQRLSAPRGDRSARRSVLAGGAVLILVCVFARCAGIVRDAKCTKARQVVEKYGRPERTRTVDLYRVKVAPLNSFQPSRLKTNHLLN